MALIPPPPSTASLSILRGPHGIQRWSLLAANSFILASLVAPAWMVSAGSATRTGASSAPARLRELTIRNSWLNANLLRDQLQATPPGQRTRSQYDEVLNAFRAIYHSDPAASKAPAAVAAVAELLAEKGRVIGDLSSSRAALGQYDFLRQQYPHSPQFENALLQQGEICRQDLHDLTCAEDKFRDVTLDQPGTSYAEQAALELRSIEAEKEAAHASGKAANHHPLPATNLYPPAGSSSAKSKAVAHSSSLAQASNLGNPHSASVAPIPTPSAAAVEPDDSIVSPIAAAAPRTSSTASHPRIVAITGMRHWSNPTSTRIAIDLGGEVQYEASRVPDPDRIFFDLHGARLAPGLNGRQVEVVDDGYLKRIRAAQFGPDVTRVVLDVTDVSQYSAFLLPNPWRLIIDIHGGKKAKAIAQLPSVQATPIPGAATPPPRPADRRTILGRSPENPSAGKQNSNPESTIADVAKLSAEPAKVDATAGPTSAPISSRPSPSHSDATEAQGPRPALSPSGRKAARRSMKPAPEVATDDAPLPHAADPASDGQRSLVRALGLKVGRIVIDAGHGGHDSGTLGPGGIQEKDIVLDVALRTGKLLHQQLGAEIVYTRSDDTFIPLETRTAIANKAQADLFLSIHGNSSPEPAARGVETYYLNFTSDPNALEVAARENAVSTNSVHQLSDLVRKITLKDKIDESREFAADVDASLFAGLKSGNAAFANAAFKDRGVKKAPFVVLIGAQMPSILAEISFLTNPDDAEQLQQGAYRQRIAVSLATGVSRYLKGLSGTEPQVAREETTSRQAPTPPPTPTRKSNAKKISRTKPTAEQDGEGN